MIKVKKTLALGAVLALLVPATAAAQSSNLGYAGPNEEITNTAQDPNDPATSTSTASDPRQVSVSRSNTGGKLPFTGTDLAVLATAGGFLLAFGFGLRRLTHRPSQA